MWRLIGFTDLLIVIVLLLIGGFLLHWQHMTSANWGYDGLQYGGLSGILPTNQVSPTFNVYTFAVAYIYSFR